MSGPVDLGEFQSAFVGEAEELLALGASCLVALEDAARRGGSDLRALRELFRAVHTIKGLSSMVGVDSIVEIAHRLETTLRTATTTRSHLSAAAIDAVVKGVQAIGVRVRAVAEGAAVPEPPAALLDALDQLADAPPAPAPAPAPRLLIDEDVAAKFSPAELAHLVELVGQGRRIVRADFTPSPARAEAGLHITSVRARLAELGEILKVVPLSMPPTPDAPGGLRFALFVATAADDAAVGAAIGVEPDGVEPVRVDKAADPEPSLEAADVDDQVSRTGIVRVDVVRLDEAMERLSALVVTRFRLGRAVAALGRSGADVRELKEIVDDNARQLRDLRAAILRVRMVRVSEAFAPIPLLVRGLARTTGKQVRLEVSAGDAEVDKGVAERLLPALIHIIRNAVDHGIEPADVRTRMGKPPEGTVTVTCFERTNSQLELSISDDGGGIDREAVARKAGRTVPTTDAALLELLCLPGVSSRDEATTTSGRGMGMDIVKRTIEQLGGEISLQTRGGAGTRLVLRVPLSISIVDAFVFTCGDQQFVTPMSLVEEVLELDPLVLTRGPHGRTTSFFERRGETVPLLALAEVFSLSTPAPAAKALLVRRGGTPVAFAVDRVLGQQEVVVRPLADPLVRVSGVTGATDLGEGRPTLVLDLGALRTARTPDALEAA